MLRSASTILLALLLAAPLAGPAMGQNRLTEGERLRLRLEGDRGRLDLLERRERRRQFQIQQQEFRAEDRRIRRGAEARPEVHRMQRNCQLRVFGNNWSKRCR